MIPKLAMRTRARRQLYCLKVCSLPINGREQHRILSVYIEDKGTLQSFHLARSLGAINPLRKLNGT